MRHSICATLPRLTVILALLIALTGARAILAQPDEAPAENPLVVHEWGYFVENSPRHVQSILDSLPREVPSFRTWSNYGATPRDRRDARLESRDVTTRLGRNFRGNLSTDAGRSEAYGSIRDAYGPERTGPPRSASTEPFLYFYSDVPRRVSVRVRFSAGEPLFWWPVAMKDESSLVWNAVDVMPRDARVPLHAWSGEAADRFGLENARRVASSPVRVNNRNEKYLFYEGGIDTSAILQRFRSWDGLHLRNMTREPLLDVLVFREGETFPFRIPVIEPESEIVVPGAIDDAEGAALLEDLEERVLVDFDEQALAVYLEKAGLYADEARVMATSIWRTGLATAPGIRVLYRIGTETYDRIYPLAISPRPDRIERVGMVLSFDVDAAIDAALADIDEYASHPLIRQDLANQLFDIVASRVANAQPLSPAMRRALKVDDRSMQVLRQVVETRPKASAADLERLIEIESQATRANWQRVTWARAMLDSRFVPYLYSGEELSEAMLAYLERYRRGIRGGQRNRYVNSIAIDPDLLR